METDTTQEFSEAALNNVKNAAKKLHTMINLKKSSKPEGLINHPYSPAKLFTCINAVIYRMKCAGIDPSDPQSWKDVGVKRSLSQIKRLMTLEELGANPYILKASKANVSKTIGWKLPVIDNE